MCRAVLVSGGRGGRKIGIEIGGWAQGNLRIAAGGNSGTQLNNRIQSVVTREYQFLRITDAKVNKSIRGMPGRQVPKKDVVHCEKFR